MSEGRIDELLAVSRRGLSPDELDELCAQVNRDAVDARLGAALREALATLTPGFDLLIDCPLPDNDVLRQVYVSSPSYAVRQNDATRALAALLTERAETPPEGGRPVVEQTEEARAMVEAVDRNAERRRRQAERE